MIRLNRQLLLPVLTVGLCGALSGWSGEGDGETTGEAAGQVPVLADFELKDQMGNSSECRFPSERPIVLMAADRKGYPSLDPWIARARDRLMDKATIIGVADLRAVPKVLRGVVERKFRKAEGYPVLLDWEGLVLNTLDPVADVPNIYLIDRSGQVILKLTGVATDVKQDKLERALEAL